jgi:CheY-like chemotaxis protein
MKSLPAERVEANLDGVQVLVVDDEPDARELVESLLRRCGAAVTSVASASEAMRSIEVGWPDVLLSDIGMPGEDGYSLIRQVRSMERQRRDRERGEGADTKTRPLPAVALTAFAARDDRRRALREGYQMHVPKPVEPEELASVVASLTGRTGA